MSVVRNRIVNEIIRCVNQILRINMKFAPSTISKINKLKFFYLILFCISTNDLNVEIEGLVRRIGA